jgi:NlpC/P60 family
MRIHSRRKWAVGISCALSFIWLGFAEVAAAKAQSTTAATESGGNLRLLSAPEGKAIVSAALEQDQGPNGAQDCSHVVHQVYVDAGFEYPYASSFDLYAGNENFERVRHPQPGDLIAWPGHVGIVLEPAEHSFYSLVSTGLEAQNYEGPYWRSRGRPRFFRFKVEDAVMANAAKAPSSARAPGSARPQDADMRIEERSAVDAPTPYRPMKTSSTVGHDPPAPRAPGVAGPTLVVQRNIVVAARNKQPTRAEVAQGISELSNTSGNVLREYDPAKLAMPVVIFERLQVERLEIKRDRGWAHLLMDSRATIADGEADYTRKREKVLWELHRTASGWQAIAPTDRTYVPQDVAVRNLAAQLAWVTEGDATAAHRETILRRESQLAKLLSGLLDRN